jgi:hypothetical protein
LISGKGSGIDHVNRNFPFDFQNDCDCISVLFSEGYLAFAVTGKVPSSSAKMIAEQCRLLDPSKLWLLNDLPMANLLN